MNLSELLKSTTQVGQSIQSSSKKDTYGGNRRTASFTLNNKSFGSVLEYNTQALYRYTYDIIELSMTISSITDKTAGAHRVQISLGSIPLRKLDLKDFCNEFGYSHMYDYLVENNVPLYEITSTYNESHPHSEEEVAIPQMGHPYIIMMKSALDLTLPVRVRCSCSDYYYTFGFYNYRRRCHIGSAPAPYERVGGERDLITIRNPRRLPGLCKHLIFFIDMLMHDGVFSKTNIYKPPKDVERFTRARIKQTYYDNSGELLYTKSAKFVRSINDNRLNFDKMFRSKPEKMKLMEETTEDYLDWD